MVESRTARMGSPESEGARRMWLVLRRRKWSQGQLAKELGTRSSAVNRWLHGGRIPSRRWLFEIERVLGIEARLWDRPPTRPLDIARS